jgi:hypothetical protein
MPNLPKFHVVVWVEKTDASPALVSNYQDQKSSITFKDERGALQ